MTGEAQITVVCSCGKKLKAPATSAGKKARCPACGAVVRLIPGESVASALATARSAAPAAAASPSPARVGGDKPRTSTAPRKPPAPTRREKPVQTDLSDQDPDGLSALYELSEQAETAAVVPDAPMCPSCRARMDSNAVLCTSCGYDTRSGKAIKTAKAAPAANAAAPWGKGKSKKQAVDRMAPDGSFMIGLLIAGGIGLAWAVVWVVLLVTIGFFLTIPIAGLIGWTIGLGLKAGQKGCSQRGGIAAGIIAILAIAGLNIVFLIAAVLLGHGGQLGLIMFNVFPGLEIISVAVAMGAAFKTASGAGS